jgi:hypothetical protein
VLSTATCFARRPPMQTDIRLILSNPGRAQQSPSLASSRRATPFGRAQLCGSVPDIPAKEIVGAPAVELTEFEEAVNVLNRRSSSHLSSTSPRCCIVAVPLTWALGLAGVWDEKAALQAQVSQLQGKVDRMAAERQKDRDSWAQQRSQLASQTSAAILSKDAMEDTVKGLKQEAAQLAMLNQRVQTPELQALQLEVHRLEDENSALRQRVSHYAEVYQQANDKMNNGERSHSLSAGPDAMHPSQKVFSPVPPTQQTSHSPFEEASGASSTASRLKLNKRKNPGDEFGTIQANQHERVHQVRALATVTWSLDPNIRDLSNVSSDPLSSIKLQKAGHWLPAEHVWHANAGRAGDLGSVLLALLCSNAATRRCRRRRCQQRSVSP